MEKSNGMKISSVFLTALALLNFRAATASGNPPPNFIPCPNSRTCATFCQNKGYLAQTNSCVIPNGSLVDGQEAVKQKNHIWQGKKLVSDADAMSPLVKKFLATTNRDEFIAVFKKAGDVGVIIVNQKSYQLLSQHAKKFGLKLSAKQISSGFYKIERYSIDRKEER